MEIIEEIFNKKLNEIHYEDIETLIGKKENSYLEVKVLSQKEKGGYKTGKNKDVSTLESHIIAPLISFLNSHHGTGCLILGLRTNNNEIISIEGLDESVIKESFEINQCFEQSLKDKIHNNIRTYNSEKLRNYEVEVKEIRFKNNIEMKIIFLIIIKRTINSNFIFYSNDTDYIYVRENDRTEKLKFNDHINFIESRKCAIVKTFLEIDKNIIKLYMKNIGKVPGKNITCIISYTSLSAKNDILSTEGLIELGKNEFSIVYQLTTGTPPSTTFIYPGPNHKIGKIILKNNNSKKISLNIEIFEEKSKASQKFEIYYNNEIKVEEKTYNWEIY